MKRSKWMALNSLLAALAIGAVVVDLIDLSRRDAAGRREPSAPDTAAVPDEAIGRTGAASPPGAGSADARVARIEEGSDVEAQDAGAESPLSLSPAPLTSSQPTGVESPAAIATGLGWRGLGAAPTETPPTKAQPAALEIPKISWLSLIGSITQADGRTFYFFKNERSGAVIRLSPTEPIEGWTLEVPAAGEYLIGKDGERYRVRRER